MSKYHFNPMACFSLLGFLGLVGLTTGDLGWYGFFGYLGSLSWLGIPNDERFRNNLTKAGQVGYFFAMLGVSLIIVQIALKANFQIIKVSIACLFIILVLGFQGLFWFFEARGN